jgi:bifunctional DNA-binding transcriptional regulator/antitoxin component of YhaV-PrlF toxin-antitoxin module
MTDYVRDSRNIYQPDWAQDPSLWPHRRNFLTDGMLPFLTAKSKQEVNMIQKTDSAQTPLMSSAAVDARGRLSVPKPIRDKLGLSGRVTIVALENCLVLVPQQQELEAITECIQSVVLGDGETPEDILAELPAAGRESFLATYGEKLTVELESELGGQK